jgi:hypothetical protein
MTKEFRAPSRLKSRIYSALVARQSQDGPLLSLDKVKARGNRLCIFEDLVQIAPVGEPAKRLNYCRVCHARLLAESLESAPVFWRGCPYARFQNR